MEKYIETNRFKFDGCEVVIHRPQLNDTEKAEREKNISVGLGKVVSDYYRQRGLWD